MGTEGIRMRRVRPRVAVLLNDVLSRHDSIA